MLIDRYTAALARHDSDAISISISLTVPSLSVVPFTAVGTDKPDSDQTKSSGEDISVTADDGKTRANCGVSAAAADS